MAELNDQEARELISVPAAIASEVRRFAAFLELDPSAHKITSAAIANASVTRPDKPDYPLWADSDVVALANAGTTTASNYRLIMDAIIREDHVGEWVSISQLSEWTGLEYSQIKTFRTHLYRHINSHFADKYTNAPFTGAWGTELSGTRKRIVYYRVSSDCAYQWERIQGELT